jgi:hypothetical protein
MGSGHGRSRLGDLSEELGLTKIQQTRVLDLQQRLRKYIAKVQRFQIKLPTSTTVYKRSQFRSSHSSPAANLPLLAVALYEQHSCASTITTDAWTVCFTCIDVLAVVITAACESSGGEKKGEEDVVVLHDGDGVQCSKTTKVCA